MILNGKIKNLTVSEIYFISFGLLAFSISLYKKIIPFFILFYLICWTIYFVSERRHVKYQFDFIRSIMMALFAVYAISLFYTTDMQKGRFDLEVKLSLLVFPLLMSLSGNFQWTKKQFNNILLSYVVGVFVTTVICYGIALYRGFTIFFTDDFFTYTYLASFHHPTYFAMFINFAISILLVKLINAKITLGTVKKVAISILLIYFIIFVFLLNSKAGLLVMFLNIIGIIFMYTFIRKRIIVMVVLLGTFILTSFILVKIVPFVNERFNEMLISLKNIQNINPDTENDSEQRILIWKYSTDIISNHWITGVGAGDVYANLNEKYVRNGFVYGIKKNLNCHNQYLQTFVATGIAGFITLLLLLVSFLVISFKRRSILGVSLFVIVAGNMLTESILEVQAGTVFVGFLMAFLLNTNID